MTTEQKFHAPCPHGATGPFCGQCYEEGPYATIAALRAELDAARAREQQLVAELECAGHDIDDLLAREAKLRAVLRQCKCIGVRDYATCDQRREPVSRMCPRCAALAEGGTRRKAIEALAAEAQALGLYDAEGEDTHEAQ